jgi:restriction system protein
MRKLIDPKNSLFAILSRQPWWVSVVIGCGLWALAHPFIPLYAPFVGAPFIGVAMYALYRQLRHGPKTDPADVLPRIAGMSWENFSLVAEEAFRRSGYTVEPATGFADFVLRKDGRKTLASCRRWKARQVGRNLVEELFRDMEKGEMDEGWLLAVGEVSAAAREFTKDKRLKILTGQELSDLVGRVGRRRFGFMPG